MDLTESIFTKLLGMFISQFFEENPKKFSKCISNFRAAIDY